MKRVLCWSVVGLLAAAPVAGQDATKESNYYPVAKGTAWTYRVTPGGHTLTVRAGDTKRVGKDDQCTLFETFRADNVKVASEAVAVKADGVSRCEVAGRPVNPPLRFLALPAKTDTTWTVRSTIGTEVGPAKSETVEGKFVLGKDEITTQYLKDEKGKPSKKKVKVITVTAQGMKVNGQVIQLTCYYAKDVGMVKQTANISGTAVVLDLIEFSPPK
jgi:hypothetical protein